MSGDQPPESFTGILVPMPEADPVVRPYRDRFDAEYLDVPAHVTLLTPWIAPDELAEADLDAVGQLAKSWQPFDVSLGAFAKFEAADDPFDVHYLAPEPVEDFLALTEDLCAVWPEYQPYGGVHDEVIPHLTLSSQATPAQADQLRLELQPLLPIRTRATELVVFEIHERRFSVRRNFRLGGKKR